MQRYKIVLKREFIDVEGKASSEWHFRHYKNHGVFLSYNYSWASIYLTRIVHSVPAAQ